MEEDILPQVSSPNPVPDTSLPISVSHHRIPKFAFILFIILILIAVISTLFLYLGKSKNSQLPDVLPTPTSVSSNTSTIVGYIPDATFDQIVSSITF